MSEQSILAKEKEVEIIKEKIDKALSVVIVDYRGLSVKEDTEMRNALRSGGVEYKVLKNSLVLRALNKCGHSGFEEILSGPTAVAFSYDDVIAPAKILVEHCAKYNKMKVKGGLVDSKVLSADDVKKYAKIPPKPVIIGQLLGMLTSPMRSLAVVLSEVAKKQG